MIVERVSLQETEPNGTIQFGNIQENRMLLTMEYFEDKAVIRIRGVLQGREVARLTEMIRECPYRRVMVDLSGLTCIDSCGIGGLLYSHQLLKRQTRQMVVTSPPDFMKEILNDFEVAELIATDPYPLAS